MSFVDPTGLSEKEISFSQLNKLQENINNKYCELTKKIDDRNFISFILSGIIDLIGKPIGAIKDGFMAKNFDTDQKEALKSINDSINYNLNNVLKDAIKNNYKLEDFLIKAEYLKDDFDNYILDVNITNNKNKETFNLAKDYIIGYKEKDMESLFDNLDPKIVEPISTTYRKKDGSILTISNDKNNKIKRINKRSKN